MFGFVAACITGPNASKNPAGWNLLEVHGESHLRSVWAHPLSRRLLQNCQQRHTINKVQPQWSNQKKTESPFPTCHRVSGISRPLLKTTQMQPYSLWTWAYKAQLGRCQTHHPAGTGWGEDPWIKIQPQSIVREAMTRKARMLSSDKGRKQAIKAKNIAKAYGCEPQKPDIGYMDKKPLNHFDLHNFLPSSRNKLWADGLHQFAQSWRAACILVRTQGKNLHIADTRGDLKTKPTQAIWNSMRLFGLWKLNHCVDTETGDNFWIQVRGGCAVNIDVHRHVCPISSFWFPILQELSRRPCRCPYSWQMNGVPPNCSKEENECWKIKTKLQKQ